MEAAGIYKTREFEFDFWKREIRMYRNRYNYLTIPFSEVRNIEVKKGRIVQNAWLLTFIAGLLFLFAIFLLSNLSFRLSEVENYAPLNHSDIRRIGANIILSISTLFFASYILYSTTKKEVVLEINQKNKPYPLMELEKQGLLEQFVEDMNDAFVGVSFDLR